MKREAGNTETDKTEAAPAPASAQPAPPLRQTYQVSAADSVMLDKDGAILEVNGAPVEVTA